MPVEEVADILAVPTSAIVKALFTKGIAVAMNSHLDRNTVKLVAAAYQAEAIDADEAEVRSRNRVHPCLMHDAACGSVLHNLNDASLQIVSSTVLTACVLRDPACLVCAPMSLA